MPSIHLLLLLSPVFINGTTNHQVTRNQRPRINSAFACGLLSYFHKISLILLLQYVLKLPSTSHALVQTLNSKGNVYNGLQLVYILLPQLPWLHFHTSARITFVKWEFDDINPLIKTHQTFLISYNPQFIHSGLLVIRFLSIHFHPFPALWASWHSWNKSYPHNLARIIIPKLGMSPTSIHLINLSTSFKDGDVYSGFLITIVTPPPPPHHTIQNMVGAQWIFAIWNFPCPLTPTPGNFPCPLPSLPHLPPHHLEHGRCSMSICHMQLSLPTHPHCS